MNTPPSLIAELEDAIKSGAKEKRVDTLRRLTDLFVSDADRFNDQQIDVFDDVLSHLIKRIEGKALVELSRRLGPVANAPSDVIGHLARNDNLEVAEPILTQSRRLSETDLIEIAKTKTQGHLLAISARPQIGSKVTDVLLQRGERPVLHKLAENAGAEFSEQGFATLVKRSEHDEKLAEKVGLRLDVPLALFRELLMRATEAVRSRLMALAKPEIRDHIQRVLTTISEDAAHEANFQNQHDYAEAMARVQAMKAAGELTEAAVLGFTRDARYADMVAALAVLCGMPLALIESLLQTQHREAVLVPCKAAGLEWPTVRAVLGCRAVGHTALSDQDMDAARVDFFRLSQSGAQRILRFWQVRRTAGNVTPPPAAMPLTRPLSERAQLNLAR